MRDFDEFNPIRSVDGKAVLVPDTYQWELEDISESDAGRTEDVKMHKKRIGQVVKLQLSWGDVSIEDAADILQKFNPEYIFVCYLDAMAGKFLTKEFYVGNRNAPLFNSEMVLWESISFNIIERDGAMEDV